jgi:hypothetical protein
MTEPGMKEPVVMIGEWQTRMFVGPTYAGGASYSADIYWGATFVCRLVYAGPVRTKLEAHASLAARALIWIASYEARIGRSVRVWAAPDADPIYESIS